MRVARWENWGELAKVQTDAGPFVGLAIGPNSDEAMVLVDGVLLQSGRVLPLATKGAYTITRINGLPGTTDEATMLTSIKRLELLLFECPDEFAATVSRPNAQYSVTVVGLPIWPTTDRALTIPFVGRRQCLFTFDSGAAGSSGCLVYGRRYSRERRQITEVLLTTIAPLTVPHAHYMGGFDNAENWHELAFDSSSTDGSAFIIEAETIGEAGLS